MDTKRDNLSMEWLCLQIVEKSLDAIVFADKEGIIQLWNSGAEALFGYTKEEAVGKSLDIIIPEHLRERHWEGYRRTMETGTTRYGKDVLSVPAIRKDGSSFPIEFTVTLIQGQKGELLGVAAIIRDVTNRLKGKQRTQEQHVRVKTKSENFPRELKYTREHWWIKLEDGKVRIGITQRVADFLTLITNVELPKAGDEIKAGDTIGIIESQKTTVDLFAPLSGNVVEVNESIVKDPLPLVFDPYGKGWMMVIKPSNPDELNELLDIEEYLKVVEWEKETLKGVGRL
jgi:glycine cleavage system H protein